VGWGGLFRRIRWVDRVKIGMIWGPVVGASGGLLFWFVVRRSGTFAGRCRASLAPLRGLGRIVELTHSLRCGLHSFAATRLQGCRTVSGLGRGECQEVVDAFAATKARDDAGLFAPAIAGNNQSDVLAYGFLGEVAEYPFGALVPAGDDSVEGLADNGIVGGVDDGGEQGGAAFGAFAVGDLAGDFGGADDTSGGVANGGDGEGNVDQGAIFALAGGVEMLDAFAAPDPGESRGEGCA
jgi:hypothetical protein